MDHVGKKKTVRINDTARDLIYEEAVTIFLNENKEIKERITKGKKLNWREIFRILEKKIS